MKFLKEFLSPFRVVFFIVTTVLLLGIIKRDNPEIPNYFLALLIIPMMVLYAFRVEWSMNNRGVAK